MHSIRKAAIVLLLAAPLVMATTGEVYWSLRGENTGALNAIDPSVDPWLIVTTSVRVTGDNQGLGLFNFRYGVRDLSLPMDPSPYIRNWARHAIPADHLAWAEAYDCPPAGNPARIIDRGEGPGMAYPPAPGTPDATLAFVDQVGASYLNWVARRYSTSLPRIGWIGDCTWGVGMDSRKSALLADPNGPYDVNVLYLDLSTWAPGPYRVDLLDGFDTEFNLPHIHAAVLRADLDLSADQPGNVLQFLDWRNLHGATLDFTIVPEPGSLLLLTGLGVLARRRR